MSSGVTETDTRTTSRRKLLLAVLTATSLGSIVLVTYRDGVHPGEAFFDRDQTDGYGFDGYGGGEYGR